jgi:hypothetical protein
VFVVGRRAKFSPFGMLGILATSAGFHQCNEPGALVEVTAEGQVGVMLDELPAGPEREAVAQSLMGEPDVFWEQRAAMQVRLSYYYFTYRHLFLVDTSDTGLPPRGQLPLPPQEDWVFRLDPVGPSRQVVDGHDMIVIGYDFSSTLVSDPASPALTEPDLALTGGIREELLTLPTDPVLLYQRTGRACTDLFDYPEDSVNAENAHLFFDSTCTDELSTPWCYQDDAPVPQSCLQALEDSTGIEEVVFRFERLKWKQRTADEHRIDPVPTGAGADLVVNTDALSDTRLVYKFFEADDCSLIEQCVDAPGWRRLLQFSSMNQNVGPEDLFVGDVQQVVDEGRNLYVLSECHGHYHFNEYGDYELSSPTLGPVAGGKQGFCLQSTNRLSNNESTTLNSDFGYCTFQGVTSGWADLYQHGLPCQWADVTDLAAAPDYTLTSVANPRDLLCEGELVQDSAGEQLWEPTSYVNEHGEPIQRQVCTDRPGADANNVGQTSVGLPEPGHGFITEPCTQGQVGPLRDCGFTYEGAHPCTPGDRVVYDAPAGTSVVRICESSEVLGVGIPCAYLDESRVANTLGTHVEFDCPAERDGSSGGYSVYLGGVYGP